MKLPLLASKIHKYLALIIGLQFAFWVLSGAFFAIVPLSKIHSDHLVKEIAPKPILATDFPAVSQIIANNPAFERFELLNSNRGPIVLAQKADNYQAFDPKTGKPLSEISPQAAKNIGDLVSLKTHASNTTIRITNHNLEYKGELPAYQIKYNDGFTLYIGANSGEVRARRSTIWRVYDTLWALHIMDWVNHDNFNNPLIRMVALLAIVLVGFGIVLFKYRFRWK